LVDLKLPNWAQAILAVDAQHCTPAHVLHTNYLHLALGIAAVLQHALDDAAAKGMGAQRNHTGQEVVNQGSDAVSGDTLNDLLDDVVAILWAYMDQAQLNQLSSTCL
jgi:hypothetical protein